METKQVHTSIDENTAKLAMLNNIGWARAIRTGVEVLSGINNNKQNILDKIENKKMEIEILNKELIKLEEREKEEEKKKEEKERGGKLFKVLK